MDDRQQKPFDSAQGKPNYAIRVMVFKDGKILLGKNCQSYGNGNYGFTGGKLEYMESFEQCAKRETMEECGIEIQDIAFQAIYNSKEGPIHNVHIVVTAQWKHGEPRVLEPEKYDSWNWYDLNNLPSPLFEKAKLALKNITTGKNYFDIES